MPTNNNSKNNSKVLDQTRIKVIIDGPNVLRHFGRRDWGTIRRLLRWAESKNISLYLFLPSYLKQEFNKQNIDLSPLWGNRQIDDDIEILLFAETHDCFVISNDNYKEYQSRFCDLIRDKLICFNILGDTFICDFELTKNRNSVNR